MDERSVWLIPIYVLLLTVVSIVVKSKNAVYQPYPLLHRIRDVLLVNNMAFPIKPPNKVLNTSGTCSWNHVHIIDDHRDMKILGQQHNQAFNIAHTFVQLEELMFNVYKQNSCLPLVHVRSYHPWTIMFSEWILFAPFQDMPNVFHISIVKFQKYVNVSCKILMLPYCVRFIVTCLDIAFC